MTETHSFPTSCENKLSISYPSKGKYGCGTFQFYGFVKIIRNKNLKYSLYLADDINHSSCNVIIFALMRICQILSDRSSLNLKSSHPK